MDRYEQLYAFLEARQAMPHEWGKNDCCLFAADWIKELTGEDPAKGLRGYKTESGAQKVIAKHGGSIRALLIEKLGEPKPAALARRGDVVLCECDGVVACGIVAGHAVAMISTTGLVMQPLGMILECWHA